MEISGNQGVGPLQNTYKSNSVDMNEKKETSKINPKEDDNVKTETIDPNKGNNVDIEV
jgi:hypothetical protein